MQALKRSIDTAGAPRCSTWPMKRQKRTGHDRNAVGPALQHYEPLAAQHIRILCLEGGRRGDPLNATFDSMSLDGQGEPQFWDWRRFEAVSYVWGQPIFSHELVMDGGVIPITASLYQALQHLRFRDRRRLLWADAICINQQDKEERSAQVAMMSDIYRKAVRVLVWLGEEDFDTRFAVSTMQCLTSEYARLGPSMDWPDISRCIARYYELTTPRSWINVVMNDSSKAFHALKSLQSIVSRSWFRRLWVVQEVAVVASVRVYVGHQEFDWDVLTHAVHMAEQFLKFMTDSHWVVAYFDSLRKPWREQSKSLRVATIPLDLLRLYRKNYRDPNIDNVGLLDILIWLCDNGCSDGRDRLYAVLALLPPWERACFRVSYDSSTADVFTAVAIHILTTPSSQEKSAGHHAAILFAIAPLTQASMDTPELPSWVPCLQSLPSALGHISEHYSHYRQQTKEPFNIERNNENPAEIIVRGVFGPLIHTTGDEMVVPDKYTELYGETYSQDRFLAALPWYIECRRFVALAYGIRFDMRESTMASASWLARLHSRTADVMCPVLEVAGYLPRGKVCHDYLHGIHCDRSSLVAEVEFATAHEELAKCCTVTGRGRRSMASTHNCRRKLSFTANRDFYWVPWTAKPGDAICSLVGVQSPFVLRALENGAYSLVGDAYRVEGEYIIGYDYRADITDGNGASTDVSDEYSVIRIQ